MFLWCSGITEVTWTLINIMLSHSLDVRHSTGPDLVKLTLTAFCVGVRAVLVTVEVLLAGGGVETTQQCC